MIPPPQRLKYKQIFNSHDPTHKGFLTGMRQPPLFRSFFLPTCLHIVSHCALTPEMTHCIQLLLLLLLVLMPQLHSFNDLFSRTTWVSQYQEGKISLDLNEARVDGVWGCSGISWTICKQSAHRCRQMSAPHHSIFTGRMLFQMPNQQYRRTTVYTLYTNSVNRLPFAKICILNICCCLFEKLEYS